jgi:Chitin synthase export chaperone
MGIECMVVKVPYILCKLTEVSVLLVFLVPPCPRSPLMYCERFWGMSVKPTSSLYAESTKSSARSKRTCHSDSCSSSIDRSLHLHTKAAAYILSVCFWYLILRGHRHFQGIRWLRFQASIGTLGHLHPLARQLILVFRTLADRWPIGDIIFGTAFFTIAQVLLFAFSVTICNAIKHYIDGLFFFTLCMLLSVMMVYKYWDSITVSHITSSFMIRQLNFWFHVARGSEGSVAGWRARWAGLL